MRASFVPRLSRTVYVELFVCVLVEIITFVAEKEYRAPSSCAMTSNG
jgi:hypothetical protein